MVDVTLGNLASLANASTAIGTINANNAAITEGFTDCLSVNDTSSNTMSVNLDMNSNHILNLPAQISPLEPLRLIDANTLTTGNITLNPVPTGGTTGQVLTKTSNSNYAVAWETPTSTINIMTNTTQFYVESGGSDSNDGLSATVSGGHGPFATLQGGIDKIFATWDFAGNDCYINVGTGTFAGAAISGFPRGAAAEDLSGGRIIVVGNGVTNTNITADPVFGVGCFVINFMDFLCGDLNLSAGSGVAGLFLQQGAHAGFQSTCRLTGTDDTSICFHTESNGFIELSASSDICDIYGTFGTFFTGDAGGSLAVDDGTINIYGTLGTLAFINQGNSMYFPASTFVVKSGGSINSYAYAIDTGANIFTDSGGSIVPSLWSDVGFVGGCARTRYVVASPSITAHTGAGSTGTAVLTSGSDAVSGSITLTAGGSSIASTGTVSVKFYENVSLDPQGVSTAGPYIVTLQNGSSGTWLSTATVFVSSDSGFNADVGRTLVFTWNNPSTDLTSSETYQINYCCLT